MRRLSTLLRPFRVVLLALAAAVLAGATGCTYLEIKEREFVYRPVREYARTPDALGLAYDDVWLAVPDAGRIHGWWLPAKGADAPTVLYLHGVRWSLGNNLFRIARWHDLGFNVLAIDYRGFGRSDGELPAEDAIYADARSAWAELVRREPRADRRFIYGHSLGAAVALDLATRVADATGVIAEAGFTSLPDVAADRHLPVGPLLTQRFDALARARALSTPVLFIHGTADVVVPARMSEELFAAAPEPRRLLLIQGGSHSNRDGTGMAEYRQAVADFVHLARIARGSAPTTVSSR